MERWILTKRTSADEWNLREKLYQKFRGKFQCHSKINHTLFTPLIILIPYIIALYAKSQTNKRVHIPSRYVSLEMVFVQHSAYQRRNNETFDRAEHHSEFLFTIVTEIFNNYSFSSDGLFADVNKTRHSTHLMSQLKIFIWRKKYEMTIVDRYSNGIIKYNELNRSWWQFDII